MTKKGCRQFAGGRRRGVLVGARSRSWRADSQRCDVETGQVVASCGRSAAQLDEGVSERGIGRTGRRRGTFQGEDRDVVERAGQDRERVEGRGIGPKCRSSSTDDGGGERARRRRVGS